jgi:hypothetical protein
MSCAASTGQGYRKALPPFRGVEITCEAKLLHDGAHEAVERTTIRVFRREKRPCLRGLHSGQPPVRLESGKLRTWDFSDDRASLG